MRVYATRRPEVLKKLRSERAAAERAARDASVRQDAETEGQGAPVELAS